MDKKLFLIVIIIIFLILNLSIGNYQKKLYNTYTAKYDYNMEDESIKFVNKFLANWRNNLTLDYLDEYVYNTYSGDNKVLLENYLKNIEVVDKQNYEAVLVKSGTSTNNVTNKQYVKLSYYVVPKNPNYTSEASGNNPYGDKECTIEVYSDRPYSFKIMLFVDNRMLDEGGSSVNPT